MFLTYNDPSVSLGKKSFSSIYSNLPFFHSRLKELGIEPFFDVSNLNTITIIGLLVITSFLGSRLVKRIGVPQIVGYIILGLVMGPSFINLVPSKLSDELVFISQIALGLIGFDIGSHLKAEDLRDKGKLITSILLSESLATFILVSGGFYLFTRDYALALLFGAISTATAPAATVDVLAECDAQGPLTTCLLAVIGLDDAAALVIYYLSAGFVESMYMNAANICILRIVAFPVYEILGSIVLGVVLSLILDALLQRIRGEHDAMALSIGFVLFTVGLSLTLHLSLILSTMAMGMVLVNRSPEHGYKIRYTIEQTGPVIYVLFFTLIGAKFNISVLPHIGALGILYIVLRSAGKYFGATFGAYMSKSDPEIYLNIGLGLLTQAGVAAGLALDAYNRFIVLGSAGEALANTVLNVITASIFVFEIIGPISCKLAVSRAGEEGKAKGTIDDWASEAHH